MKALVGIPRSNNAGTLLVIHNLFQKFVGISSNMRQTKKAVHVKINMQMTLERCRFYIIHIYLVRKDYFGKLVWIFLICCRTQWPRGL